MIEAADGLDIPDQFFFHLEWESGVVDLSLPMGPEDGQRGFELVCRIGHELLLTVKGLLETLQKIIEHDGELPQLILPMMNRDPFAKIAVADLIVLLCNLMDGIQHLAGQKVAASPNEQPCQTDPG